MADNEINKLQKRVMNGSLSRREFMRAAAASNIHAAHGHQCTLMSCVTQRVLWTMLCCQLLISGFGGYDEKVL